MIHTYVWLEVMSKFNHEIRDPIHTFIKLNSHERSMNEVTKAAILSELADKMLAQGNWCGETHIQKSTFFLQELLGVPLGFEFILYKHGPLSFDCRDFLASMRADQLLENKVRPDRFGPTLHTTEVSKEHRKRYLFTLAKYADTINFVAQKLGAMNVSELEQVSTALFVIKNEPELADDSARSVRINALKLHVSLTAAQRALNLCHKIIEEASLLKVQTASSGV